MRYVEKALDKLKQSGNSLAGFISIENTEDVVGVPPVVKFQIQSDPVGVVGINGCQVTDIIEFSKCLIESLNEAFPCPENRRTLTKLYEAIHWQQARTRDRWLRGVEGKNKS